MGCLACSEGGGADRCGGAHRCGEGGRCRSGGGEEWECGCEEWRGERSEVEVRMVTCYTAPPRSPGEVVRCLPPLLPSPPALPHLPHLATTTWPPDTWPRVGWSSGRASTAGSQVASQRTRPRCPPAPAAEKLRIAGLHNQGPTLPCGHCLAQAAGQARKRCADDAHSTMYTASL